MKITMKGMNLNSYSKNLKLILVEVKLKLQS